VPSTRLWARLRRPGGRRQQPDITGNGDGEPRLRLARTPPRPRRAHTFALAIADEAAGDQYVTDLGQELCRRSWPPPGPGHPLAAPRVPPATRPRTPRTWTYPRHPAHRQQRCGQLRAHAERLGTEGGPFPDSALRMSFSIESSPPAETPPARADNPARHPPADTQQREPLNRQRPRLQSPRARQPETPRARTRSAARCNPSRRANRIAELVALQAHPNLQPLFAPPAPAGKRRCRHAGHAGINHTSEPSARRFQTRLLHQGHPLRQLLRQNCARTSRPPSSSTLPPSSCAACEEFRRGSSVLRA
jgi:hypothetical protein